MKIEIKGHSGCSVDITREGNTLFIEKSTYDTKYVKRLLAQFEKQQKAFERASRDIRVPEIYEIRQGDDFCVARMEYVYSRNYIDHFEASGFEVVDYFIKTIENYIDDEIIHSPMTLVDRKVLIDKFLDVDDKVKNNAHINSDEVIADQMRRSGEFFNSLPEKMKIPVGICHGDMTFSNILFNRNDLYLIDFLDSFIETPLMDIVKLRQDTAYGWSTLMYTGNFDATRLAIVSNKIDNAIEHHFEKYPWFKQYYHAFQLMNFLRIVQYAKEPKVIEYLKNVVEQLLKGE